MKARDKTSQFEAPSDDAISEGVLPEKAGHELAAASERFATALRTVSVETVRVDPRASRSARIIDGKHLLWTALSDSDWRRYVGRIRRSTIH